MPDQVRRQFAGQGRVGRQRQAPGFTLLEVVLAVGLSAVVMFLIATAIQLYLFRVDSSRGEVESAQLARILLDQISRDVAGARYRDPDAAPARGEASSNTSTTSLDGTDNLPPSGASTSSPAAALWAVGLFGDAQELRLDLPTPPSSWQETLAASAHAERTSQHPPVPTSVRYYFAEGTRLSTVDQAGLGLADVDQRVAGLYMQTAPTAELVELARSADDPWEQVDRPAKLLAPEVVGLEFSYYDGAELVDAWDVTEQQTVPRGVEVRLQLYEQPRTLRETDDSDDAATTDRVNSQWVREYRRFVWIPPVRPTESGTLLALPEQQTAADGPPGSDSSTGSPGNPSNGDGDSADAS